MTDIKLTVLHDVIQGMASDAEDKGNDTFGMNLSQDDAREICHAIDYKIHYQWHSVEDDMPAEHNITKESEIVFVIIRLGNTCYSAEAYTVNGIWHMFNNEPGKITLWMPKPIIPYAKIFDDTKEEKDDNM
ncbi:MAG: hypothetical protein KBT27_09315 [Prevotellaceae bacterium]|nr:hypothetical protein [Candidatus Faecinaster equi]